MTLNWKDKFNIKSKPFSYGIRLTLADNTSKITRYNNPDKLLSDYYEGQTIGEIWGYTTAGFFKDQADIDASAKQGPQMRASPTNIWYPGDIKLEDLNKDGFINIGTNRVSNPGDRKIIGNSAARYIYGITLNADWNGFFFSTFFQGVGKQDWYPSTESEIFGDNTTDLTTIFLNGTLVICGLLKIPTLISHARCLEQLLVIQIEP